MHMHMRTHMHATRSPAVANTAAAAAAAVAACCVCRCAMLRAWQRASSCVPWGRSSGSASCRQSPAPCASTGALAQGPCAQSCAPACAVRCLHAVVSQQPSPACSRAPWHAHAVHTRCCHARAAAARRRYYVAEGVRLFAQDTWRQVMGDSGRDMVARHISQVRAAATISAQPCAPPPVQLCSLLLPTPSLSLPPSFPLSLSLCVSLSTPHARLHNALHA